MLPITSSARPIDLRTTGKMLWSSIASVAALTAVVNGQYDGETSPPSYPSPWMRGGNGWADAYERAQAFVSQLTLLEKVNLTTGVGWEEGPCVGNTGKSRSRFPPTMLGRSAKSEFFCRLNSSSQFPWSLSARQSSRSS